MARPDGRQAVNPLVRRAVDAWYGDAAPPLWARVLEPVYRGIVRLRRSAYRRGWRSSGHPGRPVIVVGNLTAGGAGKTPLVAWLVHSLRARGLRPAVISRGYGGAEPLSPHEVLVGDDAAFSGDEPLLLANLTGCPVWICRDRLAAARAAVDAGADILVADDGLQHYRLARDFELVVIDAERGLGNGRCLPAARCASPRGAWRRWTSSSATARGTTARAKACGWRWSGRRPPGWTGGSAGPCSTSSRPRCMP
jgi:tetraacyldisaccharide 4'-kinase